MRNYKKTILNTLTKKERVGPVHGSTIFAEPIGKFFYTYLFRTMHNKIFAVSVTQNDNLKDSEKVLLVIDRKPGSSEIIIITEIGGKYAKGTVCTQ